MYCIGSANSSSRKPCVKISILFIFLSFFLSSFDKLNSKTIVCMHILCILNDCSAIRHLPFPVYGGIQAMNGQLRLQNCLQKCLACSIVDFWGFCSISLGVARIVGPHLNYWMHATWVQQCVSRSSTIVFSIYLALKTNSVQPKTLLHKFCLEVVGS